MKLSVHQKKAILEHILKTDDGLFEDCDGLYEQGDEFDATLEGAVEEFVDECQTALEDLVERGQL
jgi:hypothetical protein